MKESHGEMITKFLFFTTRKSFVVYLRERRGGVRDNSGVANDTN